MKKGFTLIELLGVVIILSILSLIAVPVVSHLISGTSESSEKISASRYIEAVKLALTNRELDGEKYLKSCTISDEVLTCDGTVIEIEIKGKYPESGELLLEKTDIMSAILEYDDDKLLYIGTKNLIELSDDSNILTITFDTNGGTLTQNTKKIVNNVNYGYLPTPTRDGYEFMGWTTGVNLAPDLSEWTLSGGATYDPIEGILTLPNTNSSATSPMIYVGDTEINTIHTYKLNAYIRGSAENTGYLANTSYYTASQSKYSGNGNAHNITQEWTNYSLQIAGPTQISSGVCSYMTITFARSTQYSQQPYYVKNVDLRVQSSAIDTYEPYYITETTTVNKDSNFTLKAVWKEIN